MIKKSLYIMAVLFSTVQVNSMSLSEALGSKNIELNFNNNGKISYTNTNNETTNYIKNKDYSFENNTYFIPSNILPIVMTTTDNSNGSNVINASLLGVNNISFQSSPSNKIPDSIVFSGDNSKYTGTLYLHPAIKNIIFTKENSVISNISIPNVVPNNGLGRESKPFILPDNPKNINLYLPNNSKFGTLNVDGRFKLTLANQKEQPVSLSFYEIKDPKNTLQKSANVNLYIDNTNKSLRNININDQTGAELKNYSDDKYSDNRTNKLNERVDRLSNKVKNLDNKVNDLDFMLKYNIKIMDNNIGMIINKIGKVKEDNNLQSQIDKINEETIGESDDTGLRKRIKDIETKVGNTEGKDNLQNQITALDDKINNADNGLKQDVDNLKNKDNDLQDQINTMNETIGTDDNTGLKNRIKKLETAVGDTEGKDNLQNQITALDDKINNADNGLKQDVDNLKNKDNDLQDQINTMNETIGESDDTGLRKRIKDLENAVGDTSSKGDLQSQIDDMKNENTEGTLANRIKTVEDSIGTVKKDGVSIVPLQNQIDTLNDQINNTNDGLIKQIDEMKDETTENSLANRIKTLETAVGDTENKDPLQNQITALDNQINDADNGLKKDVDYLKKAVGTVDTTVSNNDLQSQIDEMKDETTENSLANRIKVLEDIDFVSKIIDLIENNNSLRKKIYYTSDLKILTGKCDAKWDWNNEYTTYYYTEPKCNTCNNSLFSPIPNSTKKPSEVFTTLTCTNSNCSNYNDKFTAQDIQLTSYLYPREDDYEKNTVELLCSNCNYNDERSEYNPRLSVTDWGTDPVVYIMNGSDSFNCLKCGALCTYNEYYVKEELSKIKAKHTPSP